VIGDCDLSGDHCSGADAAAAGDAGLGDHDHVLAELGVVRDLNQVVDLGAAANARNPDSGSIDTAIAADVAIVFDDDTAELGDLAVFLAVPDETEAVTADGAAGVNNATFAELCPSQQVDVGLDETVGAEDDIRGDVGPGADDAPRTDNGTRRDDRARA
jgi:hypothetical protein